MKDYKGLSDNQADDLLKSALKTLGEAPGATIRADAALTGARKTLALLSLALIAAGVKAERD